MKSGNSAKFIAFRQFIIRILVFLRRFLIWFGSSTWPFLLAAVWTVATICLLRYIESDRKLHYIGLSLQILGFGLASIGLWQTGRHFGVPLFSRPLIASIGVWWRERPRFRQNYVLGAGSIEVTAAVGKANFYHNVSDDADINHKLSFLIQRVHELQRDLYKIDERLDEKVEVVTRDIKELKEELNKSSSELGTQISIVAVGGLREDLFGIFLFVVGTLMTGFAA